MSRNRPTARIIRRVGALLSFLIAIIYLMIHFGVIDLVEMFPEYWAKRNKKILLSLLEDPSKAYDFEYGDLSSVGCKVKIHNPDDWQQIFEEMRSDLLSKGFHEDPEMAAIRKNSNGTAVRLESSDGNWFVMFFYIPETTLSDSNVVPASDFYILGIYNTANQKY